VSNTYVIAVVGLMVSAFATIAFVCTFDHLSEKPIYYKTGICCLCTKYTALRVEH